MKVKLIMFTQDGDRRDFGIAEGSSIIGRNSDAALRIPLAEISREHAEINVADGKVTIKDLHSSNGTFVNLQRIEEEEELSAGDNVNIGPVVFTLQIDGEPEDIQQVRTRLDRPGGVAPNAPTTGPGIDDIAAAMEEDPLSALEAMADDDDDAFMLEDD